MSKLLSDYLLLHHNIIHSELVIIHTIYIYITTSIMSVNKIKEAIYKAQIFLVSHHKSKI